jgi:hypothetical protein
VLYGLAADREMVREPGDLIALAETQWSAGEQAAAYATLRSAEERAREAGDQDALRRIRSQQAFFREAERTLAAQLEIRAARDGRNALERFESSFVVGAGDRRAAARELLRRCEEWQRRFSGLAEEHAEVATEADAVRALRERHLAAAAWGQPDIWSDVEFRVDRFIKRTPRRYRDALEALEAFTRAAETSEEDREKAATRAAELRIEGPEWFAERLRAIDERAAQGRLDTAVSELRFLVEEAVPQEWLGEAPERLRELEERRRER